MKKAFYSAIAAIAFLSASAAHAVTVNYNYAVPLDGSGKTSAFGGSPNVFLETFDRATAAAASPGHRTW